MKKKSFHGSIQNGHLQIFGDDFLCVWNFAQVSSWEFEKIPKMIHPMWKFWIIQRTYINLNALSYNIVQSQPPGNQQTLIHRTHNQSTLQQVREKFFISKNIIRKCLYIIITNRFKCHISWMETTKQATIWSTIIIAVIDQISIGILIDFLLNHIIFWTLKKFNFSPF